MTETYEDCLLLARVELGRARQLISNEIAAYPTPVSGCDAQFTHLLEERIRISDALTALKDPVFVPTPRSLAPGSGIESR